MRVFGTALLALLGGGCERSQPLPASPPIILISLDTLRADRIGAYGGHGLTPNLDHFADEAVVFTEAYSQASETLYSHATLLTSRYASELDQLDYAFEIPKGFPNLPTVLRLYGYQTAAVTAGGHLGQGFGFEPGFQRYDVPAEWGSFYHTGPAALQLLDSWVEDGPFFLFLHTYDAHARYVKPTPFGAWDPLEHSDLAETLVRENNATETLLEGRWFADKALPEVIELDHIRPLSAEVRAALAATEPDEEAGIYAVSEADAEYVRSAYDGAVSYLDAWFGVLMAELSARGLLDQAIIVVIADHGEELGEHGVYAHRHTLDDIVTHVPLMIRLPGASGGGRRIGGLVGLIDVMPTLIEAAGATAPAGIDGRSLWPAVLGEEFLGRDAIFSEGVLRMVSGRTAQGRLTFSGVGADSPYLIELLKTSRGDGPAWEASEGLTGADRAALRDALITWRDDVPLAQATTEAVDPDLRRRLQERGYWGP